jgi:hypothetical protein
MHTQRANRVARVWLRGALSKDRLAQARSFASETINLTKGVTRSRSWAYARCNARPNASTPKATGRLFQASDRLPIEHPVPLW